MGVLIGALNALFCRQTIYALLSLMITFIMSAFYFIQIRIYFISAILIIVYIGAITMLFLYVIMFLDIKKYAKFYYHSWRIRMLFGILFWSIISWFVSLTNSEQNLFFKNESYTMLYNILCESDIVAISKTLYSCYGELILIIGFLLFIVIVIATDIAQPAVLKNEKVHNIFFEKKFVE